VNSPAAGIFQTHTSAFDHSLLGCSDCQGRILTNSLSPLINRRHKFFYRDNLVYQTYPVCLLGINPFSVNSISAALHDGMARGNLWVPPPPGSRPTATSLNPKRASLRLFLYRKPAPSLIHHPMHTINTGNERLPQLKSTPWSRRQCALTFCPFSARVRASFISAPAQNALSPAR